MLSIAFSLFLLGLYFGSGPCLASCGPLLVSYVAGSLKNIRGSIFAYLLFSFSRITVYLVLGLVIFFGKLALGQALENNARYLYLAGGIFIMLIGVLMALGKNAKFCQKIDSLFLKKDAKTILLFGLIIGILPCAPLISVISYIGLVAKNWLQSILLSLAFGIGTLISPLFLISALAGFIPKILKNSQRLYQIFNFICGLVIIALGFGLIRRAF